MLNYSLMLYFEYNTLLFVELQVPNIDNSDILEGGDFEELSTTFVSYIIAFVIIGIYWITYHSVFNPIRHTTDLMVSLNLSFLLLIALIPFSVRLIDKYDNQFSFIIYSLIQVLPGMMLFLIWQHAIRKRILLGKSNDGKDTINSTHYQTHLHSDNHNTDCIYIFNHNFLLLSGHS